MASQEALIQEIKSLPPTLLTEVLDFVLFLKIKSRIPEDKFLEKVRDRQFPQEFQNLTREYRTRYKMDPR